MNPSEANSYPRRFGPLVLVQFLEEGGMGRVYLALRGTRSNPSPCVVKFMGSAYTDPLIKLEERFHQEVQIAKSLSHPHIASTFQSGISDQGPYLVQEFVHGLSLRALASSVADDTGHFEIPLAAYIVSCVAEALEYVHEFGGQGLVHRDVTPENVMLSFQGDVKLIDFGVAKSTTNDPNLTVAGGWVGKPYWTAPELFRGGRLDRRADLYALGLLLWYLLSGKDPAHTMEHLVGDKEHYPPASRFHPGLPPELDDIVRKSLSLDPAERYPTADSLRQALAGYIPDGYPGKAALRAFLGRYSSPTSEASLKSLLDSGIPLLGHTATQVTQKLYFNRAARPKTRGRWTKAFLLLMMGGAAVSAVYSTFRPLPPIPSPPPEAPAVPPPATPPPASPPPTPPAPVLVPDAASAPIVDPPPPDAAPARPEPPARRAHRKPKSPDLPTGGGQGAESTESAESANSILAEAQDSFERSELPQALSLARYAAKEGAGAKAYILIGIILAMQRDIPGARAALEKALELSPGNAEALKHLERLRR